MVAYMKDHKKRVCIYCFYDKDGIVDDYVIYYLKQVLKICIKVLFVSNGELSLESYKKLKQLPSIQVYERKNIDFDAGAFKFGLNKLEDEIEQYDQLILSNNSFFGPIFPLEETFSEMETRSETKAIDFWGMTIHLKSDERIDKTQQFDYINEHVQSYFIVFNKNVFTSGVFKKFISGLPPLKSFAEAVCLYELRLTQTLSDAGFKYDSYVDNTLYPPQNTTILYPLDIIKISKMPIVKRKVFTSDYQHTFAVSRGHFAADTMNYIRDNTNYDVNLIWQHLLRTNTMSSLRMNLQLNKVLDVHSCIRSKSVESKTALILYIFYKENIDDCLRYALNMPDGSDLYLVSAKSEVLEIAKQKIDNMPTHAFSEIKYITKINKGRDLSSYLIDCSFVFKEYDYVCYFHDKRCPQLGNQIMTREFFEHCMESLLPSKEFAINVVASFENDRNLGLLVPPPLIWGEFYATEYLLHPNNEQLMKVLIEELDLKVPFDPTPVAPYGDMFWVRGKAALKLFNKKWTYTDLPGEPLAIDGTLMHALERILPFVAQSSGFYTSWLMASSYAHIFINNLYYIDKTLNNTLFAKYGHSLFPRLLEQINVPTEKQKDSFNFYLSDINRLNSMFLKLKVHNLRKKYKKNKKYILQQVKKLNLFDENWYLNNNEDVRGQKADPFIHYIEKGWKEGRSPSGLFNSSDYLELNPDVQLYNLCPLIHYYFFKDKRLILENYSQKNKITEEIAIKAIKNSRYFNAKYYLENNKDVKDASIDPAIHYYRHGWREGRLPSNKFNDKLYLAKYADVTKLDICPLLHYELIGKYQMRVAE